VPWRFSLYRGSTEIGTHSRLQSPSLLRHSSRGLGSRMIGTWVKNGSIFTTLFAYCRRYRNWKSFGTRPINFELYFKILFCRKTPIYDTGLYDQMQKISLFLLYWALRFIHRNDSDEKKSSILSHSQSATRRMKLLLEKKHHSRRLIGRAMCFH